MTDIPGFTAGYQPTTDEIRARLAAAVNESLTATDTAALLEAFAQSIRRDDQCSYDCSYCHDEDDA